MRAGIDGDLKCFTGKKLTRKKRKNIAFAGCILLFVPHKKAVIIYFIKRRYFYESLNVKRKSQ